MDVKKVYNRVEDFLLDDKFIRAVLCNSPFSTAYLELLKKENAGSLDLMDEARTILTMEYPDVSDLSENECRMLKEKIVSTLNLKYMSY